MARRPKRRGNVGNSHIICQVFSLPLSLSRPSQSWKNWFFPNAGEQIKGQNDCVAKRNRRHGTVINLTIKSPMFSFALQEFFWLLCNELATHYHVVITNLINKNRDTELVEPLKICQEVSCGTYISVKVIKAECNWMQRCLCNHSQQLLFCTESRLLYFAPAKVI